MDWRELTKKTKILLIGLALLLAASLFIAAFSVAKRYGGREIANIVRDSIEAEKIVQGSGGVKIVSDQAVVTFRQDVSGSQKKTIVASAGARLEGPVTDHPEGYIISFRPATWREIRTLLDKLQASPDVLAAEPISVDR